MTSEYVFTRFERTCEQFPDRTAVIYLGESYSFSWLQEKIARFATALDALGIRKDDKVLLFLPNCVQWVIAYFGLQKIGAIPVLNQNRLSFSPPTHA